MKLISFKYLISITLTVTSMSIYAQVKPSSFTKPEQAIEYRKSVFTVQARAFSQIRAMLKGDVPFNAADIKTNANIIHTLSALPWTAFSVGTDSSKTQPDIWTDATGFKDAAAKYMLATAALDLAAKTGDVGQIKTAVGTLGATCKQCHDAYKK
jgi:cytochrome c556